MSPTSGEDYLAAHGTPIRSIRRVPMPFSAIRTILVAVAVPASPPPALLERTAQLAEAFAADVIIYHAAFEPFLSGRPFFDSRRLAKSRGSVVAERTRQLNRHVASLQRRGIAAESCVVWEEPAHEAIVRAAIRMDAGLVIAGTHQARPDSPPRLRLTDWELLRLCPRPLLLVRSTASTAELGTVVAALDPTHAHDKPGALDMTLARHGASFAGALGGDFHVVHCIPRQLYPAAGQVADPKQLREQMQTKLQRLLRKSAVTARKIHVIRGDVDTAISQLARRLHAQALVLGALSRRGLQRVVIGNTAERIIHDAPCDLLIIKPDNFKWRLGRSRKQEIVLPT
jgi:universal stress protein E